MPFDFDERLRSMAGVVVRVGLNLQPGQPLLITDPYELQGIHPESAALVAAILAVARTDETVITADPRQLRSIVEANDTRAYRRLVSGHTRRLQQHLARGGAFLFLTGSHPGLFAGMPSERLGEFDRIKWRHLGPVIQQLVRGATQWTLVPAPTVVWSDLAFPDRPAADRLPALWRLLFDTLRLDSDDPQAAWALHLAALARRRDGLNQARHRTIRYLGAGTDLRLSLPSSHRWCTAEQISTRGVTFVANLPTEEIFTAPAKDSAEGRIRVARPVVHAGSLIDGITLEFVGGKVVAAHATTGHDLLQQLLRTDDGARRIGEVAIVPGRNRLSLAGRLFHHAILDENACNHVALGAAYRFCSRAWWPQALNSSQIHLDLPLDATVELS